MAFPLGDILRSFISEKSFFGKLLRAVKGTKISVGGTDILLDQNNGATPPRTGLDQPHRFDAPNIGPRHD